MQDRKLLIGSALWGMAVVTTFAVRAAMVPAPIVATEYAGWLLVLAAPIFITATLVRGMLPATIAKVLYDADRSKKS